MSIFVGSPSYDLPAKVDFPFYRVLGRSLFLYRQGLVVTRVYVGLSIFTAAVSDTSDSRLDRRFYHYDIQFV